MSTKKYLSLLAGLVLFASCDTVQHVWKSLRAHTKKNSKPAIALHSVVVKAVSASNSREIPSRIIDILHTDLALQFNWGKHECNGEAVITLTPYFYETDSIVLDAHSMRFSLMELKTLSGDDVLFTSDYNKDELRLHLDRKLAVGDTVMLTLRYTASPDEVENLGGKAIRGDKGLYFINTDHSEPSQPVQLWTQGETEANSCWFPTIDKPNEKFTLSIAITVNKELTTLSNGLLKSSRVNGNLRTDTWVSAKPMPAYLAMMAVGDFQMTKDTLMGMVTQNYTTYTYDTVRHYSMDDSMMHIDSIIKIPYQQVRDVKKDLLNGVEIAYYLEPAYHPYAKTIFKNTPEMVDFYSAKLGVPFPWEKYAQVIVRDYVSGAMENTSATLHGESVQKTNRELLDAPNDDIIAHELFHQWFGDLVTCESWSHLVLNEGFASYGEQLWVEYKYGNDAALVKAWNAMNRYLQYAESNNDHPIIRFDYGARDDMFNAITYQKGARVLHLLRTDLGDEAFFMSLKNYLQQYACSNAQIDDLRRVCEKVSGRDLRAFFDQWFYRGGHPILDIHYDYNDSTHRMAVTIEQKQSNAMGLFHFPLTFTVRQGAQKRDYTFSIRKQKEIFWVSPFDNHHPDKPNVFVDPYATFIGEIHDNKPILSWVNSYYSAGNVIEKLRSLEALKTLQSIQDTARKVLLSALTDENETVRIKVLEWVNWKEKGNYGAVRDLLIQMANKDKVISVRAKATEVLAQAKDQELLNTFIGLVHDSSYTIAGNALQGLYQIYPQEALHFCRKMEKEARKKLFSQIASVYAGDGESKDSNFFISNLMIVGMRTRIELMANYTTYCIRLHQFELYKTAISLLDERAIQDRYPAVRFNAILNLMAIQEKWQQLADREKDTTLKVKLQADASGLQHRIQEIIDRQTDEEVIQLLKTKSILQTQSQTEKTE